jgi:cyclophilin family peptidyl-prolyl cis-trans isomerase
MIRTMKKYSIFAFLALFLLSCQDKNSHLKDGLYAEIKTVKGDIICQLEFEKTPITVANFVLLTEGKNPFVSPDLKNKPFYNGLKFHRVIADFMIQGGDPLGNGSGDGGYKFKDEITDLKFDNGGLLAMANSGPGTNGSQFFITHKETPWLDGKHTIFGHVVENGMENVNKIVQDDAIISITIIRKGEAAKKFDALKVFSNYFEKEAENLKNQEKIAAEQKAVYITKFKPVLDEQSALIKNLVATGTKSTTGIVYKITKKGSAKKPEAGKLININYAGFFEDGSLFESNIEQIATKFGKKDPIRASQNGYQPIVFEAGRKEGMIPGFLEAIDKMNLGDKMMVFIPSNLAYGEGGNENGIIPPNTNVIFEIEILNK